MVVVVIIITLLVMIIITMKITIVIIITMIIHHSMLYLLGIEFHYFFMDDIFDLIFWIIGSKSLHGLTCFYFSLYFYFILSFNINF
jgi:hypothetical protein